MDFKQIQELIKMINKSNIGEVSIEEKGFKLTIKQKEEPVQQLIAAPMQAQPIATLAVLWGQNPHRSRREFRRLRQQWRSLFCYGNSSPGRT